MLRLFPVLIAFAALVSGCSAFAKAHGSFLSTATTTCNINTGVATGLDAGTCASPVAVCDGVTDVKAAFAAFNTWAKATTTNANGQLIELVVTGQCVFATTGGSPFIGLKKARLRGYGATFQSDCCQPSLGTSGVVGTPQGTYSGICHLGLSNPNGCSARIATVSTGATSIFLLNTALCSRFTSGGWILITGFDLQGTFNNPYGYPPNPHYFNAAKVTSTTNCATTGEIRLSQALTNNYLSTWPNYNSGDALEADQGGPGTVYALDANWGGETEVLGVTIVSANQSIYQGLSVRMQDVTWSGGGCLQPSQTASLVISNGNMAGCNIEVDKIIKVYQLLGVTMGVLTVQSSSIDIMTISNSSMTLSGTSRTTTVANSTIRNATIAPIAYGRADSANFANVNITAAVAGAGLLEKSPNDVGSNKYYTQSSGVMSAPDGVNVTGFANNGSGKVRLTVTSSTGWTTGALASITGVFSTCPGGNCPGGVVLTIVDGTHIDLLDLNFTDYTWTSSGQLVNSAPRWAVPGTNLFWVGALDAQQSAFQVTGVTQDASGTHIATSQAGGIPTLPLAGGSKLYLRVQAPKWTCSGCTGVADAVDFAGAPPNIPMYSYSKRTYTNSSSLDQHPVYGKVTSIKFNVTQAYTGSTTPLVFQMIENTVIPSGTSTFYGANIDLRTAGLRTITPAGVTCNTGGGPVAGGCGTDSGLTLPDPAAFFATLATPGMTTSPVDQPWTMSVEFIMDQGVVVPPP